MTDNRIYYKNEDRINVDVTIPDHKDLENDNAPPEIKALLKDLENDKFFCIVREILNSKKKYSYKNASGENNEKILVNQNKKLLLL